MPRLRRERERKLSGKLFPWRELTFNKRAVPPVGSTNGRPRVNRAPDPGQCNRVAVERAEAAE